jgi:hypothetical protein
MALPHVNASYRNQGKWFHHGKEVRRPLFSVVSGKLRTQSGSQGRWGWHQQKGVQFIWSDSQS